ncbi:23940_t:CDS:2, partial [Gigaspora rosea]
RENLSGLLANTQAAIPYHLLERESCNLGNESGADYDFRTDFKRKRVVKTINMDYVRITRHIPGEGWWQNTSLSLTKSKKFKIATNIPSFLKKDPVNMNWQRSEECRRKSDDNA